MCVCLLCLYKVSLSISLMSFGIGTMLGNFYMCGIMLLLRAVLNMLVRNASPRGPMSFRCLIFSLSGPCELLFLLCFISSWTLVEVSVMVYHCMFYVALSIDLFVLCVAYLTVFDKCLLKQFAIRLCVVVILLLHVMVLFRVVGGALIDRPCIVFSKSVCCACDPIVCLDAPSTWLFVFLYAGSYLPS